LGGAFWAMDGAGTYFVFDNSNYRLLYERGNGRLSYMRSDDVDLWNVDSAGNCTIHGTLSSSTGSFLVSGPGNVTTGGSIAASGSIASNSIIESASDVFARGGHYWFGNADQAVLSTTAAGTSLRFSADGWALSWSASAGTLGFFNNSAQPIFTVDHSGNGTFLGTVHGTNVTALEDRIALLEARIAALGG
jgi:hypothetical protein